jgi:HAD superfamily hydrolase (TIGR01549 family)
MIRHLIFDFDGVLADSLEPIAWAFKHSRRRYSILPLETIKSGIRKFVNTPKHANANNLDETEKIEMINEIQKVGRILVEQNNVQFFEGFIAELRKIENFKMAIVSSGSESYLNHFSKQIDLPFDFVYGVETSLSKEEKIVKVCENWGISLRDCWYFTDTLSDIIEIKDLVDNDKILGCSWGWHSTSKLQRALPKNQVLIDFADVKRFFGEIEV